MDTEWKEVSMNEFYRDIGPRENLSVSIVNSKWPYTSVFKTNSGEICGKIEGYLPPGSGLEAKRFLLPESKETKRGSC